MPKILNTEARQKSARAQEKADRRLAEKGWRHDGLWWISPYSGLRYAKREALSVEEIREWGESDSAFLLDKSHSMWVKAEEDANRLISMDDMARISKARQDVKRAAIDGCYARRVK